MFQMMAIFARMIQTYNLRRNQFFRYSKLNNFQITLLDTIESFYNPRLFFLEKSYPILYPKIFLFS